MARVELEESWKTSAKYEELIQIIDDFFRENKITETSSKDARIEGRQGSQFMTRCFGGLIVSAKWFPKRITIGLRKDEEGTNVEVKIEESLGFGSILGMKQKYLDYFYRLMHELKKLLN